MKRTTELPAWRSLQALAERPSSLQILLSDSARTRQLQHRLGSLVVDLSHQRIDAPTWSALLQLAEETGLPAAATAMAKGAHINPTEDRPALHMALRTPGDAAWQPPWGEALNESVLKERARMLAFADQLRGGQIRTPRGEAFTDLVNIGIGGSDLGPRMATAALSVSARPTEAQPIRIHFLSNPDLWAAADLFGRIHPATTLFLIQSKTFTTQETRALFETAQAQMAESLQVTEDQALGWFAAVTASPQVAQSLGFSAERLFGFWDWVGGRTSVWSSIGLPLAVLIGSEAFEDFLAGAHQIDRHFLETPPDKNLPMLLALVDCWNRNFLHQTSKAVVSYDWRLRDFTRYLQQLEMESNGKRTLADGSNVTTPTAPVIWGGLGIDGQHAYFQLLHQGTDPVPVDFISTSSNGTEAQTKGSLENTAQTLPADLPAARAAALSTICEENLQAQRTALALGRGAEETAEALRAEGLSEARIAALTPHRTYPGNRPSTLLRLDPLSPASLGSLIALYEHKVYCQSVIWGSCAFDQWGVELGKTLVKRAHG